MTFSERGFEFGLRTLCTYKPERRLLRCDDFSDGEADVEAEVFEEWTFDRAGRPVLREFGDLHSNASIYLYVDAYDYDRAGRLARHRRGKWTLGGARDKSTGEFELEWVTEIVHDRLAADRARRAPRNRIHAENEEIRLYDEHGRFAALQLWRSDLAEPWTVFSNRRDAAGRLVEVVYAARNGSRARAAIRYDDFARTSIREDYDRSVLESREISLYGRAGNEVMGLHEKGGHLRLVSFSSDDPVTHTRTSTWFDFEENTIRMVAATYGCGPQGDVDKDPPDYPPEEPPPFPPLDATGAPN